VLAKLLIELPAVSTVATSTHTHAHIYTHTCIHARRRADHIVLCAHGCHARTPIHTQRDVLITCSRCPQLSHTLTHIHKLRLITLFSVPTTVTRAHLHTLTRTHTYTHTHTHTNTHRCADYAVLGAHGRHMPCGAKPCGPQAFGLPHRPPGQRQPKQKVLVGVAIGWPEPYIYTVFFCRKSPNIWSYALYIWSSPRQNHPKQCQ
jgi:hypothetical protein